MRAVLTLGACLPPGLQKKKKKIKKKAGVLRLACERAHNCFPPSFPTITSTSSHYQAMRHNKRSHYAQEEEGIGIKVLSVDINNKKQPSWLSNSGSKLN